MGVTLGGIIDTIVTAASSAGAAVEGGIGALNSAIGFGGSAALQAAGLPTAVADTVASGAGDLVAGGINGGLIGGGVGAGEAALTGKPILHGFEQGAEGGAITGGAIGLTPEIAPTLGIGTQATSGLLGALGGAAGGFATGNNPLIGAATGGISGAIAGAPSNAGSGATGGGVSSPAGTAAPASVAPTAVDPSLVLQSDSSGLGATSSNLPGAFGNGAAAGGGASNLSAPQLSSGSDLPSSIASTPVDLGASGSSISLGGGPSLAPNLQPQIPDISQFTGASGGLSSNLGAPSPSAFSGLSPAASPVTQIAGQPQIAPTPQVGSDASAIATLTPQQMAGAQIGPNGSAVGGAGGGGGGNGVLSYLAKHPGVDLAGAGLAMSAIRGNQPLPGESALQSEAATLKNQGTALESYLTTGQLPPGMQAAYTQASNDAAASIRSYYASLGMSGSSAEAADIANANTRMAGQVSQMALQLFQQGASETQASSQLYQVLMQSQLQQDQELQGAIGSFASSLALSGALGRGGG